MPVSSHDVAATLRERIPGLPTKKLHKLLYYCQGHHLAAFGEPLMEETVSAWDMGPVVGELWFQEKQDGVLSVVDRLSEAQLNTIGYVVSRYGQLTGRDLEHLTYNETPWHRANLHRGQGESVRIEQAWMREYFDTVADEDDNEGALDSPSVSSWLGQAVARRADNLREDSYDELRAQLTRGE